MSEQIKNIRFVGEVKKHPELYNYKLPGYSRKDMTEQAWLDVAYRVNMTVPECKARWRNLRTVFLRKMKPSPDGSRMNRKAYYLAEAMQFCLPYIKVSASLPSGNLSQAPEHEMDDDDSQIGVMYDDSGSVEDLQDEMKAQLALPESSSDPPGQSTAEKSVKNESAAASDEYVAEYLEAKRARLKTTVNRVSSRRRSTEKKEALRMFLLSLMPELEEFNDSQIKIFKRRVFNIIDEIADPLHTQTDFSNVLGNSEACHSSKQIAYKASPSHASASPTQPQQSNEDFQLDLSSSDGDMQES